MNKIPFHLGLKFIMHDVERRISWDMEVSSSVNYGGYCIKERMLGDTTVLTNYCGDTLLTTYEEFKRSCEENNYIIGDIQCNY